MIDISNAHSRGIGSERASLEASKKFARTLFLLQKDSGVVRYRQVTQNRPHMVVDHGFNKPPVSQLVAAPKRTDSLSKSPQYPIAILFIDRRHAFLQEAAISASSMPQLQRLFFSALSTHSKDGSNNRVSCTTVRSFSQITAHGSILYKYLFVVLFVFVSCQCSKAYDTTRKAGYR